MCKHCENYDFLSDFESIHLDYDTAWLISICCYANGYSDWKMPTFDEYNCNDCRRISGVHWRPRITVPDYKMRLLLIRDKT